MSLNNNHMKKLFFAICKITYAAYIILSNIWFVGDRIRDLLLIDQKVVLMLLEGNHNVLPSIGLLELDLNE